MISTQIVREIKNLEHKNNLFQLKNNCGLYFWDIVRYDVFYQILIDKGIFNPSGSSKHQSTTLQRIYRLIHAAFNLIFFSFMTSKKDILFYTVSRNFDSNGYNYDAVLKDLIESTDSNYYIETFFNSKHSQPFNNRYWLHALQLNHKFIKSRASSIEYDWVSKIINQSFNLDRDWGVFIAEIIDRYSNEKKAYLKILKKVKPKVLIFNRNGFLAPLVSAAHQMNVKVFEMQHGSITPASLFYNYPEDINLTHLSTLPDTLFLLGDYWSKSVSGGVEKIIIGNNEIYRELVRERSNHRVLTVISGKFVFEELIAFTVQLSEHIPDYKIYFKLHPGEQMHRKPAKEKTATKTNIEVVYDEMSVERLLQKSQSVLLIQSTCAYSALQAGCNLFVLKRHYYQESSDIFGFDNVYLVDNIMDALNGLRKKSKASDVEFFTDFKEDRFKKIIKQELG